MNVMLPQKAGPGRAQRAIGRLKLAFRHDPAARLTRISTFYQEGCLKARLPRPAHADMCEAVTLNISGGVAGGDLLEIHVSLGEGARVTLASQAAERLYRALAAEPAHINTRITLGPGARLDYLPQETIFFDGFALNRRLQVELAPEAEFLGVESLVFGRQAAGERVLAGNLRDCIALRRGGVLVLQDMTRLEGAISAILARKAVAAGGVAVGQILYAAPNAAARLEAVRAVLAAQDCLAGATLQEGVLRARMIAPSAAALRGCMVTALNICRDGRELPRVWQG